jgi:hypothetical protein
MTRFASCYFCGTALDGSVSEQPVVPDDLAPEGGSRRSVTLCPDCSRKLDAVMDEVRAAVGPGDEPSADSAAGESGAREAGSDDEGIDADVEIDASAEEFFEEASQPEGADSSEDAAGADEKREADASASKSEQRSDRGAAAGTSGGGDPAVEEEAEPAKQTISALENSKVMRMLENREFPVERQSFQVVAANAYGVSPSDVGKVIDMAIDRGLLAERNGDLVRPE